MTDRPSPEVFAALIAAKREEVNRLEGVKRAAAATFYEARNELADLMIASKPEQWPTPAQLEAVRIAVRNCRDEKPTTSHHGNGCGPEGDPYAATWHERGFVRVPNTAPFLPDYAGKAWSMGEAEQEIVRRVIEEEGATIVDAWLSDGLSFNIKFEKVAETMVLTEEYAHFRDEHSACRFEEPDHVCSCHSMPPCGNCEQCPAWIEEAWEAGQP